MDFYEILFFWIAPIVGLVALLSQIGILVKASENPKLLTRGSVFAAFIIVSVVFSLVVSAAVGFGLFVLILVLWPPSC